VQVYKQRSEQYGPIYKETFGDISTVVISDLDEYDKVIAVDGRYPNRIELEPIVHYRNDAARSRYKVIPRWNSRSRKREGPLRGGGKLERAACAICHPTYNGVSALKELKALSPIMEKSYCTLPQEAWHGARHRQRVIIAVHRVAVTQFCSMSVPVDFCRHLVGKNS